MCNDGDLNFGSPKIWGSFLEKPPNFVPFNFKHVSEGIPRNGLIMQHGCLDLLCCWSDIAYSYSHCN